MTAEQEEYLAKMIDEIEKARDPEDVVGFQMSRSTAEAHEIKINKKGKGHVVIRGKRYRVTVVGPLRDRFKR